MGLIITCIVGGLIGALAGMITGKDFPLGIVGNVIAGLIGSWVGSALFGHWGFLNGEASLFFRRY